MRKGDTVGSQGTLVDPTKVPVGSLTPAFGRDYRTGADALCDWNAGKDFTINNPWMSTYCSIRDTADAPIGHTLQLRYARKTMVGIITKQADGSFTGVFDDEHDAEYVNPNN